MSNLTTDSIIGMISLLSMLIMLYVVSGILESLRKIARDSAAMHATLVSTQGDIKRLLKKLSPEILDD